MPVEHDFAQLAKLGWKPRQLQEVTLEELERCPIARVTSIERDCIGLASADATRVGRLAARLRHGGADEERRVTVGDWVLLEAHDPAAEPVIRRVLPRTSVLERTAPGQERRASVARQTLCANVDTALVLAALDAPPNLRRIERFIALARTGGARAVVVLSKADRCASPETECERCAARLVSCDVVTLDARAPSSRERLAPWLLAGDTLVLLGPSGVGKSTLANTLADETLQSTAAVRERDAKGRHTTTRRSLFRLPGDICLIDTPGLRELALASDESVLEQGFEDIATLARGCRFGNCSHDTEPGCAVAAAMRAGTLAADRLEGYRRLLAEARIRERRAESAHSRRARERAFGKAVRGAMSDKRRRRGG